MSERLSAEPGRNSIFWRETDDAPTYWEVLASVHHGRRYVSVLHDGWAVAEWDASTRHITRRPRETIPPRVSELAEQAIRSEILP